MKKLYNLLFAAILFSPFQLVAQTVGVLQHEDGVYEGYTLFGAMQDSSTFLIDNCGREINRWTFSNDIASASYLRPDGTLLRGGVVLNANFSTVGNGGMLQIVDWDSNVQWEYVISDSLNALHHDIQPMANGNVLAIGYERVFQPEAIQMGRDSLAFDEAYIYMEVIYEIEPVGATGANIIWEWHAKDHLIQDFDATKDNFGVVRDNLHKINVNYRADNAPNWVHLNAIFYDEDRDHILLSSRKFSEIWVLDHSTTTAQAATSAGGNGGLGGDIIYRRGNDSAHGIGTFAEAIQYGQHDIRVIPAGFTNGGAYMLFNNGSQRPDGSYSTIDVFEPVYNETTGVFETQGDSIFTPAPLIEEFRATPKEDFFSGFISGAERMPNGNTLVCEGANGRFFEFDSNDSIVWEYMNPVSFNDSIFSQGETPSANIVFRTKKYPVDYPGFANKDLTPGDRIEGDPLPLPEKCIISSINDNLVNEIAVFISPNPSQGAVRITALEPMKSVVIYNTLGQRVFKEIYNDELIELSLEGYKDGMYLIEINNSFIQKLIIE